jgi:putative hydrolase of the HAD superfamily
MSDYDGVIVDFGGVLTTPLQDSMLAFATDIGIELQDFVRVALAAYMGGEDPLVADFETGRISESEFTGRFAHRIKEVSDIDVETEGLVTRIFSGIALEESMFAALGAMRKANLGLALCSNSWGGDLYPRERLESLFDVIVISGEVGMRKPDLEIYELTLERMGLSAKGSVFVDDYPGNLKPATEMGMTTVLHRDPASTIAELEELLGMELIEASAQR